MDNNYFKSSIIESVYLHPQLKKYIHHISFDETVQGSNDFCPVPSIPFGMTELVINLGNPYYRSGKNNCSEFDIISQSHIVGFKTRSSLIIPTKGAKAISILFKPGCLSLFTKETLIEFTDKTVDAEIIFGPEFTLLNEQLSETSLIHEQSEIIQNFLLTRLSIDDKVNEFLNIIGNMYNEKSSYSLKNIISKKADYKSLERKFYRYVGTTPKIFHQILSFSYATKLIRERGDSFTQIAYECNYFDQSHFIKKFKEFSGCTPGEYVKLDNEMIKFQQKVIDSLF